MCGIGGFVGSECLGVEDGDAILDSLRHRGPDASGRHDWRGPNSAWTLLHTRLSIVDLSDAGNQPMPNEDETLWMSFNGEIYNSAELRTYCEGRGHIFRSKSDGEVILHLWEMEGWRCLRRLNGIFAVAMADAVSGEVWLARDPMGVKPLFYCRDTANQMWFGSEIRTLRASGCPLGSFDTTAFAQFLTFLWVPDPRTPYLNVRSVEPGHVIRWRARETSDFTFLGPVDLIPDSRSDPEDLSDELRDAVRRQLMADVPVSIMASGGIDSSLVWHEAREQLASAYTIDWSEEVGDEGLSEDTKAVRDLEVALGTPVTYIDGSSTEIGLLPPSGDLFADPAYELVRRMSAQARDDGSKVLLSGQGADELLAGYRRHRIARFAGKLPAHLGNSIRTALQHSGRESITLEYFARSLMSLAAKDPFAGYMALCSYSDSRERAQILGCGEGEVIDEVVWSRHQEMYSSFPASWSRLRRALLLDLAVYLPALGLAYSDRAGMDASVEVRVPLLDLRFAGWCLGLRDRDVLTASGGKAPARRLAEQWMGRDIGRRRKRGLAIPKRMLRAPQAGTTSRGFRQSRYVALASEMVHSFRSLPPRQGTRQ